VCHKTYQTRSVRGIPGLLGGFLKKEGRRLDPPVRSACIDFAGARGAGPRQGFLTNYPRDFRRRKYRGYRRRPGDLLNDFEAVGFGLEVLIANRPEAFVRLSRTGKLRPCRQATYRRDSGRRDRAGNRGTYPRFLERQISTLPGEGGHADLVTVEDLEFRVSCWIRKHRTTSPGNPVDTEKVVSGPGLANVFEALAELEPQIGDPALRKKVFRNKVSDRPRPDQRKMPPGTPCVARHSTCGSAATRPRGKKTALSSLGAGRRLPCRRNCRQDPSGNAVGRIHQGVYALRHGQHPASP